MAGIKDKIFLEEQTIKLSLEQKGSGFRRFLQNFPQPKRKLLLALAIAIIPAAIVVRVGARLITEYSLSREVITAHPSYASPSEPAISAATVLKGGPGWYSAYAQVANQNLDLSAAAIPYHFYFYDSKHQQVASTAGTTYLLANQKKYLVVSRVESAEVIASAELKLDSFQWQKRLAIPEISLKAAPPILSTETAPPALVAEGAVVNNSPYNLGAIQLVFLLYDKNNAVIAVSQRDEFTLPAFGRRAYRQTWPGLDATTVSRIVVVPDTNSLDNSNVSSGGGTAPISRPPANSQ